MGADDEPTFESAESGASHTYPMGAGEIRKGSHLMIKGRPCKCVEVSTSKTGKHGHAKAHIVAIDIFTGKKMEDLCPTSHNLNADDSTGEVSLLQDSGDTKDDPNLPNRVKIGEPTEDDEKTSKEILDAFEAGKTTFAIVQAACGEEKIVGVKTTDN